MLKHVIRVVCLAFSITLLGAAVVFAESCPEYNSSPAAAPVAAVAFPDYEAKFVQHRGEFYGVTTAAEYRARAQAIVEGRNPGVEQCDGNNGRTIYWDPVEGSVVFVQYGVIQTYYKASYAHYRSQCVVAEPNSGGVWG